MRNNEVLPSERKMTVNLKTSSQEKYPVGMK
jgi:hypothetical protein